MKRFSAVWAAAALVIFGCCMQSGSFVAASRDTVADTLIPCGNAIGIKIENDGVIVVGTSDIKGGTSPALESGLKEGDVILKVNGVEVADTEALRREVSKSNGKKINVDYERDGKIKQAVITPVKNPSDNSYYLGVWVRDSTAGIGTMTWFDPKTGQYGALGHSVSDVDTGKMMDVSAGEIVQVSVTGADKGKKGSPGILTGEFLEYQGTLEKNCDAGVVGKIENTWLLPDNPEMPIAKQNEISYGDAQIICCIEGTNVEKYSAQVEQLMDNPFFGNRNMVIRVTDERLLRKTGGIVQGLSGSPIIQNGKLIGAVTHVFVNDPTRGYGIFIENMLEQVNK